MPVERPIGEQPVNPESELVVDTARVAGVRLNFVPREDFMSLSPGEVFLYPFLGLVMCQKPPYGPSANQLVLPGGKLSKGEISDGEGSLKAAAREAYEETGIEPDLQKPIGERSYSFYHPGSANGRATQESVCFGKYPSLPFVLPDQPGAKVDGVLVLEPEEFKSLLKGGRIEGVPGVVYGKLSPFPVSLLDSLRVEDPNFGQDANLQMDDTAINATREIIKAIQEDWLQEEAKFKALMGRKFLALLEALKEEERFSESDLDVVKNKVFGGRLRELENEKKGVEEKLNMLNKINFFFAQNLSNIDAGSELLIEALWKAYLAAFIEWNLGIFEKAGQAGLGFTKVFECLPESAREEVIFLVEKRLIETGDEVLNIIFELFVECNSLFLQRKGVGEIHSELDKKWKELVGENVSFRAAMEQVMAFYNYIYDKWKKLTGEEGPFSEIPSTIAALPIRDFIDRVKRGDVDYLRYLVIAATYAKFSQLIEEKGLGQPPLINSIIINAAEKEGWSAVKEYKELSQVSPGSGIRWYLSAKERDSLLRKILERGVRLSEFFDQVKDLWRIMVVWEEKEKKLEDGVVEFLKEVVGMLRKLLDGTEIKIGSVNVTGSECEEQWEAIKKRLEKMRIEIVGESKVKSAASSPPFEWIKFALGYVIKEACHWIEFQFFPGVEEFREKLRDDIRYALDRMCRAGKGRQPLLRLLFDEPIWRIIIQYSSLFTRPD